MKKYLYLVLLSFLVACSSSGDDTAPKINRLSTTINGANTSAVATGVELTPKIEVTFDAALSPANFERAVSLTSATGGAATYQLSFTNASSRAVILPAFDLSTTYTLSIAAVAIGAQGERLTDPYTLSIITMEDGTIRFMDPCTTASAACERTVTFSTGSGNADFSFYSNYPIYEENAEWEKLTTAVILMHGVNRNSDDYFSWMNSTFANLSIGSKTILIAPSFRIQSEATGDELYWSSSEWREGDNAKGSVAMSSFAVIDSMVLQLGDEEKFPVLENIIITGHSSGGLFTHLYAAAGVAESDNPGLDFSYVVANSQFFYYPGPERVNESTVELYTPSGCTGYQLWPLGYNSVPAYVSEVGQQQFDNQYVSRSVIYLLGNGNQADPTLNTTNCSYTLLGSTRFKRGENIYSYMEQTYGETHNHQKVIVNGIGHDGQNMYQSPEWQVLLGALVGN